MMSDTKDGGPAFPIGSGDLRDPCGMSLRDWFAGRAMESCPVNAYDHKGRAEWMYREADAMIAERERDSHDAR